MAMVWPAVLALIAYGVVAGLVDRIRRRDWPSLKRYLACLGIILLVLCSICMFVAYRLLSAIDVLKRNAARGDMRACAQALALYRNDVTGGTWPATLQQVVADDAPGWSGPYMATVATDPWDNQYRYQSDGTSYTITSAHAPPAPFWSTPDPVVITHTATDTIP